MGVVLGVAWFFPHVALSFIIALAVCAGAWGLADLWPGQYAPPARLVAARLAYAIAILLVGIAVMAIIT